MRKELVEIVCCPDCRNTLKLVGPTYDDQGDITAGKLHCKKCDFDFPIEEGIPNLLPKELHS